ncbi:TetR/AcrR family transcriptional regulator [Streptomyces sp. H10-C2]|uniref:TetR/AcrR family transcriptional regulator n=1 Tax=unclassified Streptomyces TaxID=2593676 RepID=UPI0024BA1F9A|nr:MULTISPECIES: TetR/AcrR family transcriptional regulator [unclassified Streptomyces]MDJ0344161.1 TetR/AcrR family transcriptional regulator [Streptomyces sp. PH10-H1]MDJ0373080.1 TetR/AcrR family transcriptional regulator [Streptomyces sp. H10-C2]
MDTAERLIESTQELLWERGYTGTSPKAIQQHAGAGQGSMYHHFSGKPDLALTAMRRSAEQLRAQADAQMSGGGTALERVSAYLLRDRDALRGCRVGRMAMDPDVIDSAELRGPVQETFAWLRGRLAEIIAEGLAAGEFDAALDPGDTAATIVAVVQGGYVLARAEGSQEPFRQAVRGAVALLAARSTVNVSLTD